MGSSEMLRKAMFEYVMKYCSEIMDMLQTEVLRRINLEETIRQQNNTTNLLKEEYEAKLKDEVRTTLDLRYELNTEKQRRKAFEEDARHQNNAVKLLIEKYENKIKECEEKLRCAEHRLRLSVLGFELEIEEHRLKRDTWMDDSDSTAKENEVVREEPTERLNEIQEMRLNLEDLKKANASLKEELTSKSIQIETLVKDMSEMEDKYRSELQRVTENLEAEQSKVMFLTDREQALIQKLDARKTEIKTLINKRSKCQDLLTEYSKQEIATKWLKQEYESKIERLSENLRNAQKKVNSLTARESALMDKLDTLMINSMGSKDHINAETFGSQDLEEIRINLPTEKQQLNPLNVAVNNTEHLNVAVNNKEHSNVSVNNTEPLNIAVNNTEPHHADNNEQALCKQSAVSQSLLFSTWRPVLQIKTTTTPPISLAEAALKCAQANIPTLQEIVQSNLFTALCQQDKQRWSQAMFPYPPTSTDPTTSSLGTQLNHPTVNHGDSQLKDGTLKTLCQKIKSTGLGPLNMPNSWTSPYQGCDLQMQTNQQRSIVRKDQSLWQANSKRRPIQKGNPPPLQLNRQPAYEQNNKFNWVVPFPYSNQSQVQLNQQPFFVQNYQSSMQENSRSSNFQGSSQPQVQLNQQPPFVQSNQSSQSSVKIRRMMENVIQYLREVQEYADERTTS